MKVSIYREHCVRAGLIAGCDSDIDEYRMLNDGQDCGDVKVYEGAPEELLDLAKCIESNARSGGGGMYDRKVAQSLRIAVEEVV